MKKYQYMHTINGCPGNYEGEQVCFASRNRPIRLAPDLKTIKKQQAASIRWRTSKGFTNTSEYGWVKVLIP